MAELQIKKQFLERFKYKISVFNSMKRGLLIIIFIFLIFSISVFAQETLNSYIIQFEDSFINVIDFLFGSNEFSVSFLKFAAWVILFSFLTRGFERIFYYHRLLAVISSLLVSIIGIRLIPYYYFEISTPLVMWFAIAIILIGAPYAILTIFRLRGRLKNFLWFVAILIEIFYIGQLGDVGYAFRTPLFYDLTYMFGKYWELIIIGLVIVGVGFLFGKGHKGFAGVAPLKERPTKIRPQIEERPQKVPGWGKALGAAFGIDFLRNLLTDRRSREILKESVKGGAKAVTKSFKDTAKLWSKSCNTCGAPLNKGPKCNNCGTAYPWRDRWRVDKKFEKQQKAAKNIEERIATLGQMINDADYLIKKNPTKYDDLKPKILKWERERNQLVQSLNKLMNG